MSNPYNAREQRVYEEAIRTVPGLIACKERKAPADAALLFDGYMEKAKAEGLSNQQSWSILFNAAIHWAHQLVRGVSSQDGDRSTLEILTGMGALAAAWTT